MRIVALFEHPARDRGLVSDLAHVYGVPVIEPPDIQLFALTENYQIYRGNEPGEPNSQEQDKRRFWK